MSRPMNPLVTRVGVPAVVGIPALLDQGSEENAPAAWALCLLAVVLSVAGSVAREHAPVRSFLAVLAVGVTTQLTAAAGSIEVTTLVVLPLGFAFYFLGRFAPLTVSAVTAAGSVALMLGALVLNQVTAAPEHGGGVDVVSVVLALPLGWAVGLVVRGRELELDRARRDHEQQAELEGRRVADARTHERLAISRDMHDIVAHSLTALTVHAEVLRSRAGEIPPWANERIDALAQVARQANHELHGLLATLREAEPGPAATTAEGPAPRLADLSDLAATARDAGQAVAWEIGDTGGLSRLQEAAVYRIVQECLNNARRHAPGATTRVRLEREDGVLVVDVTTTAVAAHAGASSPDSAGLGLLGIGERVHSLGGEVTHGPTPEGGFAVIARVPVLPTPSGMGAAT